MINATLEKQIQSLPDEYIDEVSNYIDYLLFRLKANKKNQSNDLNEFFGSIKNIGDGIEFQRSARDEWD